MNNDTTNNKNKKIFIGHGHSDIWLRLKDFIVNTLGLEHEEFNRISTAGTPTSDRLKEMLEESCIAFLIMTGEDEHADNLLHARENVIHEVGLFQGKLGFARAIILLEEGCKEFSNIHGITHIPFPKGNIRAAFEDIRDVLKRESILEPESIPEQEPDQNIPTNTDKDYSIREYWREFKVYCNNHGMSLQPVSWNQHHSQYFGFRLNLNFVSEKHIWLATWRDPSNHRIAVNLHFKRGESGSEDIFNLLMEDQENIEEAFDSGLTWQREPFFSALGPLVGIYKYITPDRDNWQEQFEWMFTTLNELNQIFCPFILRNFNHELSNPITHLELTNKIHKRLSITAERFIISTTLEERETIGRKVAALRINAEGSKGMAWRKIREELRRTEGFHLKQEDLREVIRREDHFKESVVERIESFEGGWEYQGDLTDLCGFEPTGEWLDRIEACKPRRNNKGRRFL